MKELVEFLTARLGEDERTARTASRSGFPTPSDDPQWEYRDVLDKLSRANAGPDSAAYIFDHDPARALRDVEAKRRIIGLYVAAVAADDAETDQELGYATWARRKALEGVVKIHAACYADHRDYVEEWRP